MAPHSASRRGEQRSRAVPPLAASIRAGLDARAGRGYGPANDGGHTMRTRDAVIALAGMAIYVLILTWL